MKPSKPLPGAQSGRQLDQRLATPHIKRDDNGNIGRRDDPIGASQPEFGTDLEAQALYNNLMGREPSDFASLQRLRK